MILTDNLRNSADIVPINNGRDATGRFAAGNPGRTPGSKNRISNEALRAVKDMKDEAIIQLRAKLESGDWDAIIFVLSRILPKDRTVELSDVSPSSIATALADGTLTPDEARNIATAISRLKDIDQLDEMRARLDELENIVANARK